MSLLTEKKYSLDQAAQKLGLSRATFNRHVRPRLRVITHSPKNIEVPESSLDEYLTNSLTLGAAPAKGEPVKAGKRPIRKRR